MGFLIVFIGGGIGAALHGDTVRVAVVARTPRGPEGRVDAIDKRRNPRVSGVLRKHDIDAGRGEWSH